MAPKQIKGNEKRGHLRKESTNTTPKTGRGLPAGQPKRGPQHVDAPAPAKAVRPVPGDHHSRGVVRSTDVPVSRLDAKFAD